MVKSFFFFITPLILLSFLSLHAQEGTAIQNRSETIQYIEDRPFYMHAVLQGQTLYAIARAYSVSVEAIIHENPDLQDGLRYDQIIRIPVLDDTDSTPEMRVEMHAPEPDSEYVEHKVSRRETLFGLSQLYDIPIETILYYNPEAREGLQIGQNLRIPIKSLPLEHEPLEDEEVVDIADLQEEKIDTYPSDSLISYTVVPGDTKFGISRRMQVSIEKLEEFNPHIVDGLQAGQQLQIPVVAEQQSVRLRGADQEYITITPQTTRFKRRATDPYCHNPMLKETYKVALLIPFFLDELGPKPEADSLELHDADATPGFRWDDERLHRTDSFDADDDSWMEELSLDHKSFTFISYYQGVLLALDSIRQQGLEVKLYVHDVCQDLEKAVSVTDDPEFEQMDLIIGPFHRHPLDHIAAYGKQNNIPVISPLLPGNDQLEGKPNLFKVTPSLETMLDGVAAHIAQNYPGQNIIIVHNRQPGAAHIIDAFQDTLLHAVAASNHYFDSLNLARINGYYFDDTFVGSRQTNVLVMPDTVSVMMPVTDMRQRKIRVPKPYNVQELIFRHHGMDGLKPLLRKDRQNILVTLISGEPFLSDYLRQLHGSRHQYDITVFGIPEWQSYASIEIDYLQNLKVHTFVPDFYDYGDFHIQDFVHSYRRMFQTEPDADAFKAAQTAYFFFNALGVYGTEFERCMPLLNQQGYESPFRFQQAFGAENGWENQHFHIYRTQNYRLFDVQRPADMRLTQE